MFVGIKPEKLYSASCGGREVNPWEWSHTDRRTNHVHANDHWTKQMATLSFFLFWVSKTQPDHWIRSFFCFVFESAQLARQLHQERTQMEVQIHFLSGLGSRHVMDLQIQFVQGARKILFLFF